MLYQAYCFKKSDDKRGLMAPQGVGIQIIEAEYFGRVMMSESRSQRMKTTEYIGTEFQDE